MSENIKPALPPRRPSPVGDGVVVDSPVEIRSSNPIASSTIPAPPRLPPRKSAPDLPPILVQTSATDIPANIPSTNATTVPPTSITVTPATPSTPIHHSPPPTNGIAPRDFASAPGGFVQEKISPTERYKEVLNEQVEAAKPIIEEVIHAGRQHEWGLITAALVFLAWLQVSLLWIILLGALAVLWFNAHPEHLPPGSPRDKDRVKAAKEQNDVTWVNHALYALFPLISTDVLTPFIDLLEDALAQQVPPMVTSVRLASAALGSQPMLLTSMRHMTDQEWFAALSKKPKDPEEIKEKGHTRNRSSGSGLTNLTRHRRSESSASAHPSLHRSASASSTGSVLDSEGMAELTQNMRKRDRILRKIPRRRRTREGATDVGHSGEVLRDGDDPVAEAQKQDGSRHVGGPDGDVDEDDPNAGQYVNYQVGFEYQQPKEAHERRGWGLHVLAFFGVGVKGVGKTELPIYIDMVKITGTINVRLLLSATPPFVRNATISFPKLPFFDISAKPLVKNAFNAMGLPGMRSYVQSSIADVAQAFVSPASYSLDVDRLLLGRESSIRTAAVGVLQIMIHGAEDLPKTDTMGSCDPYVGISFTKFNKPMFSTRTILRNRDPWWEEEAFILVTADAIEAGERLRLRVCDSDRFSADDAMGVVEVELSDLVERGKASSTEELDRRADELQGERPGMRTSGTLHWSIKFHGNWEMAPEEVHERLMKRKRDIKGQPDDIETPWWIEQIKKLVGEPPTWAEDRKQRRQEAVAWITGEKEKDEMEVSDPPSSELRSGVLQFHIHQCVDLEVESLAGTFSSTAVSNKSAANGKPALADVVDRTPAENPEPPSAYCEVHINDRLIYRTRTKQMTPLPYFNAVSERFLRDWRMAKLTFVIRDERDREHDPILGIVSLKLTDVFKHASQMTRWFPLVGGLGWGRIRISLLWKPIDIVLPPRVSGFEIATLQIKSLTSTDLTKLSDRPISIVLETEADKYTLNPGNDGSTNPWKSDENVNEVGSNVHKRAVSLSGQGPPGTPQSSRSVMGYDPEDSTELDWEITKSIGLAVEYRHSCSLIISFVARGRLKKKKTVALALIRLSDCEDSSDMLRTVPIFGTSDVGHAVRASHRYATMTENDAASVRHDRGHVRARPSFSSSKSAPEIPLLGFVSVGFVLHPGVSRAHRKLCKKDLRFKRVYEAWEISQDIEKGLDKIAPGDNIRRRKDALLESQDGEDDEDKDEGDSSGESGDEDEDDQDEGDGTLMSEGKAFMADRKTHKEALHRRNKGIFQLKIARTGKFVKDKIAAKVYAGASGASGKLDRRPRGADMDVEHEGTSKI